MSTARSRHTSFAHVDGVKLTTDEQLELAALCGLAWEHRGGDVREHIEAIVTWTTAAISAPMSAGRRSHDAVLQVLRETSPQPRGDRHAA